MSCLSIDGVPTSLGWVSICKLYVHILGFALTLLLSVNTTVNTMTVFRPVVHLNTINVIMIHLLVDGVPTSLRVPVNTIENVMSVF